MLTIFTYSGCGTCRKAVKFLIARGIAFRERPIREQPPSVAELRRMLAILGGDRRRLFNTSGQDYRALGLKDRLAAMSVADTLTLLAGNGNLVKRPFVLADDRGVVGFDATAWEALLADLPKDP